MQKEQAIRILNNPTFQKMAKKKAILGWSFTFLMLLVYFSFIGYIAVSPETFGTPVTDGGFTTIGIYAGLFVILFSILITGVYVYKANGEFDRLTQEAIEESEVDR